MTVRSRTSATSSLHALGAAAFMFVLNHFVLKTELQAA